MSSGLERYAITFRFEVAGSSPDRGLREAMMALVQRHGRDDAGLQHELLERFGECELFGHALGSGFGVEIRR